MNIEPLVREKVHELRLPLNVHVDVKHNPDIHPYSENPKDSYYVAIDLVREEYDFCSYINFWYNNSEKVIEHVSISLGNEIRNRGFARGLVESMETIGKDLGCKKVILNWVTNPGFWRHLGYEIYGRTGEKSLLN
jgi:GNAT superfamily N-acetyltransferase